MPSSPQESRSTRAICRWVLGGRGGSQKEGRKGERKRKRTLAVTLPVSFSFFATSSACSYGRDESATEKKEERERGDVLLLVERAPPRQSCALPVAFAPFSPSPPEREDRTCAFNWQESVVVPRKQGGRKESLRENAHEVQRRYPPRLTRQYLPNLIPPQHPSRSRHTILLLLLIAILILPPPLPSASPSRNP
jgi:hypothetical protein